MSPSPPPILEAPPPDSRSATESATAALRAAAYRHLARREHSAWELRRKLQTAAAGDGKRAAGKRKRAGVTVTVAAAELPALLDRLLAELASAGAQSDARFAEHLARWRFQTGRGPVKLRFELTEHQIDPARIDQVMAEYEPQWRASAARVRARKFGDAPPPDYKAWARQARFLQQRGFTAEHIEPFGG